VTKGNKKRKGQGVMLQPFALRLPSIFSTLYLFTVNNHAFCCEPLEVLVWSSWLPASGITS
jgi:hypothetical protein